MADAGLVAALKVSAAAERLAFRGSEILSSDGVSNSREDNAAMSGSFWKPQLRIRVPKFERKSFRVMRCRATLPRKLSCKGVFEAGNIIRTKAPFKHVFALGINCRDAWRAVELLCSDERERRTLASAAVAAAAAVTLGFSVSLSLPAIAETAGIADSRISFAESSNVVDVDAHRSPEETLAFNSALRRLSMTQNDLNTDQAASSITDRGRESLRALPITDGLIVRKHEFESTAFNSEVTSPLKSAVELTDRSEHGDANTAETIGVLIPASCPPSNLVAVAAVGPMVSATAAVGSMASSASVAGNAVTQSSALLHPLPPIPGTQLLTRILQHLGGGGVAGAVGASVVYPLDTIKTRMQGQSSKDGEEPQYKDEFDCFRQLLTEEGPASLYSGILPQVLGIAPEKALKLTVNEVLLQTLEQGLPGARVWLLEVIAGGGGGFSQVLVTNPMEIVKLRLQMQSKSVSSKGLVQIVKELGLQGLYCGSGITLARDIPGSAIFFACNAFFNQLYPDQIFWAGFLAAIPATILVTPLDVIKTRLQMETPPGEEPYKNAWHCFRVLLQEEGLRGLFKGGLLRVLRTSPQLGITLMIYSLF